MQICANLCDAKKCHLCYILNVKYSTKQGKYYITDGAFTQDLNGLIGSQLFFEKMDKYIMIQDVDFDCMLRVGEKETFETIESKLYLIDKLCLLKSQTDQH